ncbi:MAG TPA: tyrosine-type recombinase/integrase [Paenibacillus sp.]|uniref:tyrosine-type recombinase/integrase n=1 Tax=Paenibacillus sp. TaxID=58172 RepID=UPI002C221F38|nr:tyrosine-type recombinase/integrase [Paenibacillus sp.]HUC91975.1 tyrosine-type recombinase/integrase [Paenibacillus sp.]
MSSNVVPIFNEKNPFKKQKRRKNAIADMQSYRGPESTLSWEEAVGLFIQAKRTETASARTVEYEQENLDSYRKMMKEQGIEPQVEGLSVDFLRKHFVAYMVDEKEYALNTINNRIKTIKRFFAFLHREGWILQNPSEHLKIRSGQRPVIYSFTEEQVIALLDQPDQTTFTGYRDYCMLYLMLDTGLRLGEVLNLKINQADLKQCYLLGVLGKSKRPRDVPFCDDVRKVLLKYLKVRGEMPESALFVTVDGVPLSGRTFQETLKAYGEKAGIEGVRVSPHTLRHTFAKMYILNGGDPYSLQEILGHTTQDMVKVYVNLWKPEKKLQHTKASPMRNLRRKK